MKRRNVFLLAIPLVVIVLLWLGYLSWNAGRGAGEPSRHLAATLLVATPRPYRDARGYNYGDLERLERVARAYQRGALWRGLFLGLGLAVTLFLLFAGAQATRIGYLLLSSSASQLPAWLNALAVLGFLLVVEKRWLASQFGFRLDNEGGEQPLYVDGEGRRWYLLPLGGHA